MELAPRMPSWPAARTDCTKQAGHMDASDPISPGSTSCKQGAVHIWVLAGRDAEEYKGVAKFFSFLSSAEIQADWHQFTGYLPVTHAAYDLTKSQGFYDKNPGTDTSIKQMTNKEPTANSKGLRFGNFVQIRDIINEELEAVWAGSKSAQDALDTAVSRGNDLLRKFEKANK
ncbi:MAG: extracellular solute-binding protein [Rhodospirillales bacterium]